MNIVEKNLLKSFSKDLILNNYVLKCIKDTNDNFSLFALGKIKKNNYFVSFGHDVSIFINGEKERQPSTLINSSEHIENAFIIRTNKTAKDFFEDWFCSNKKQLKIFYEHFEPIQINFKST